MMRKVVTVIGARPQFIKSIPVSKELNKFVNEVVVHTGQHYDHNMSDIFFEELGVRPPAYNLSVGSGMHGDQTGKMMSRLEALLIDECPDMVLVYGDTNSTLAGALVAAKLHIPIAHVEAGLRSFNKKMPEEINRIVTDHCSSLLFCTSSIARDNLLAERILDNVEVVGDVMRDSLEIARNHKSNFVIGMRRALGFDDYILMTVHRAENTEDESALRNILIGLSRVGMQVIWPIHPRTKSLLENSSLNVPANIHVIPPVGYIDSIHLITESVLVVTDSGGMQKEAYWLGVQCVTVRDETEWLETVNLGWNTLVKPIENSVYKVVRDRLEASVSAESNETDAYGGLGASIRCAELIADFLE